MNKRIWFFSSALMIAAALAPAQAQLFGPSDEEVAREKNQDDQITALNGQLDQAKSRIQELSDKIDSLTQSLTQATGANEELSHQLSLLGERLDREEKDFSYRLCTLSAQQLGADSQGLNCAAAGGAAAPLAAPASGAPTPLQPGAPLPPLGSAQGGSDQLTLNASGAPAVASADGPGKPPGVLGTLPAGGPGAAGKGNQAQFDAAMNLLAKAQYAEASAAFRSYADANPGDSELSSQAIYWIGDIAYVQKDYDGAARGFAELLKKYPSASRAPDAMLKLGQSLLAEGQTSGGCTTLALLKTKYPKASASTVAAANAARKTACSK
jgi:tol-pal system protein YbgF